jgi:WD40 repeat protein
VRLSPNNTLIATADRDEKIRVSRLSLPDDIVSFCMGHTQFVTKLLFCTLGGTKNEALISGSGDGTLRSWNPLTGKEMGRLRLGKQKTQEERKAEEEHEQSLNPSARHELIHTRVEPIVVPLLSFGATVLVGVESEPNVYLVDVGEDGTFKIATMIELPSSPLSAMLVDSANHAFATSLEDGSLFFHPQSAALKNTPNIITEKENEVETLLSSLKFACLRKLYVAPKKGKRDESEEEPEAKKARQENE